MLKKGFRENQIHRWLARLPVFRGVEVGIGHDAAVARGAERLILKVDQVVARIHFASDCPAGLAGRKALSRALSDCAAAGAKPLYALASLAVPPQGWSERRVRDFLLGVVEAGRRHGVSLVGGDLSRSRSDFVASISLVGSLPGKKSPGLRSGARPGHELLVTGALGGSILKKHLHFSPRLKEGQRLRERFQVGAIMDLSDGLAADLPRMCRASGVGAIVDAALVPISSAAKTLSQRSGRSPLWHALCDGEDYELLWTAASPQARKMLCDPLLRRAGVRRIGAIVRSRSVRLRQTNGSEGPFPKGGHEHAWV